VTPSINFCMATCSPNPTDEMFHKSLVQLVQDIRRYGAVNVNEGKIFSKYALDRLDSSTCTGLRKFRCPLVNEI
jgi:hypothetical protein